MKKLGLNRVNPIRFETGVSQAWMTRFIAAILNPLSVQSNLLGDCGSGWGRE